MTRHDVFLSAVFIAALGVSVSAIPAKTAPELQTIAAAEPQTLQSAQIHTLVGSSFHSFHVGF